MDLDDFRDMLVNNGVDLWSAIDSSIALAVMDRPDEIKDRRDRIVERLYASSAPRCRNCDVAEEGLVDGGGSEAREPPSPVMDRATPETPKFVDNEPSYEDQHHDRDQQAKILAIKEELEDPDQADDSIMEMLQNLVDMEITFQSLQETDIGRHVNRLRKHPSEDVRRLVKPLVRRWKDIVDDWVKVNSTGEISSSAAIIAAVASGDSPQQKPKMNGNHQSSSSPNLHNRISVPEKNNIDAEMKNRAIRRDRISPPSSSIPQRRKEQEIDAERLASARKRLQQNYQDAENAKKQRTIQVMDIHEIPKPKNAFFARGRGGGAFHGGRPR